VSADCTWYATHEDKRRGSIPIGRPIANTQIYLLDSNLQPVPVGVPAEIHVGGAGLAQGYFNRPDFTREKFIPNPYHPQNRLYKTGDFARYLPDGNIEFIGRIDHQVKIRGFRIEPGEIESILTDHRFVRQSVVTLREDAHGENCLVAYIVPNKSGSTSISELVNYLRRKLPDYMIPSAFVTLNSMPLTPNGKVDRRSLPAPETKRPELDQTYTAARSEVEHYLSSLWSEMLRIDRVGIHDRFFELGGNSIQAARCVHKLQTELGVNIPIISLFEAPTINEYSAFLKNNYSHALKGRFKTISGHISLNNGQTKTSGNREGSASVEGQVLNGSLAGSKRLNLRRTYAGRQRQLRQAHQKFKNMTEKKQ